MEREAYEAMADCEKSHWWFVGRRAIIRSLIERNVQLPAGARILEAGCGTGGNLEMLAEFGELQALEFDDDARKFARESSGHDVKAGSLPNGTTEIHPPFDLIALLDVLEHIKHDEESLRSLATFLTPTGKILLTVPALQSLWSDHDERHHHFRRYSHKSLAEVLCKAGLEIEYISYFNTFLFPIAAAQRTFSQLRHGSSTLNAMPEKHLNRILAWIFGAERVFLGTFRFPIGLSLCAICSLK